MRKLIMLVLAVLLALGISCAAYAATTATIIKIVPESSSGETPDDDEEPSEEEPITYENGDPLFEEKFVEALGQAEDGTTELVIDVSAFKTLLLGDPEDTESTPGTINLLDTLTEETELESVTLQGSGSTVLKLAGSGVRHFIVNHPDVTFGLKGVTLTGGGVYVTAGTLSADNVTFSSNAAPSDESGLGGAIHVAETGIASLKNCTFTENTATSGGAIYSAGGKESTFSGLTFGGEQQADANYATNGGAVYLAGGEQTFTDTTFRNNSADLGGAFYVASGTLNLAGGNVLDFNRANSGGAIYLADSENAKLNLSGSSGMTFRGNNAKNAGGAIYAGEHSKIASSIEVTFDENYTTGDDGVGGALWLSVGSQIDNFAGKTSFGDNRASYGGAVYIASEKQSLAKFTSQGEFSFVNNSATYEGGAIYTVKADVTISSLEITDTNEAGTGGGFLRSGGTTMIQSSTISGQKAQYGGAIYSVGAITIDNSTFEANSAKATMKNVGGGAIFASGLLKITSSDFIENTNENGEEDNGGGAIFVSGDATIYDSAFAGNTHTTNENKASGGGAIYTCGNLTVENTEFTNNRATGTSSGARAGAIYANAGSKKPAISITNCLFSSNSSNNNGGAIVISGQYTSKIEDSTFISNVASANGGAIYPQGSITISTSYFYSNRSSANGGAVYFDQHNNADTPGTITIESSMFTANSAGVAPLTGQGGALYLKPDAATITRCTFYENQSSAVNAESRGGAIYLDINDTAVATVTSIKNSVFFGNQVHDGTTNYGGAIYLTGQDISLVSDTFTGGNSAIERGGAVYVGSGTMTIAASIIVGNTADNGRDIYAEGTITSRGYNRIGVYGKGGNDTSWTADITTSRTDRENSAWTMTTFFGEDAELVDTDGFVQAPKIGSSLGETGKVALLAIPLNEADSLSATDRATNVIPFARRFSLNIDQYDIWGIDRFSGNNDISLGAFYLGGDGAGVGEDEDGLYEISSISMSGIPNTLKSIGQTSSLVAIIHYINGRTAYGVPYDRTTVAKNQEERVRWSSSMPAFVKVDSSGNITALQMTNNTNGATITVSTVRGTPSGRAATDSRAVKVTGQYSYMNTISPAYQNYFSDYVQDIMEHDISISLTEVDSSTVLATGFQRNFASAWNGAKAKAVTDLSVSTPSFSTPTTYPNSQGLAASNGAAVNILFKDRSNGDLFPLTYSWNLTGAQVKALLGSTMSNQSINDSFAERLFNALRVDFQTATQNMTVIGSGGVKGSDARRYGALTLTKADGNAGLHIELTAYLANVAASGSGDGPQLVRGSGTKRLLVVPDGANDGAITGTMWLAQSVSTVVRETPSGGNDGTSNNTPSNSNSNSGGNSSSSGGGGGGGCAAMNLGLLGAIVILLKRK